MEIRRFVGHGGSVTSVAFSPDGRSVLTGSDDKTARLWETATGRQIRPLRGHTGWVAAVAFSPDGGLRPHRFLGQDGTPLAGGDRSRGPAPRGSHEGGGLRRLLARRCTGRHGFLGSDGVGLGRGDGSRRPAPGRTHGGGDLRVVLARWPAPGHGRHRRHDPPLGRRGGRRALLAPSPSPRGAGRSSTNRGATTPARAATCRDCTGWSAWR